MANLFLKINFFSIPYRIVSPTDNPAGGGTGDQRKVTIRTVVRRPPARSTTIRAEPQIKSTTAKSYTGKEYTAMDFQLRTVTK